MAQDPQGTSGSTNPGLDDSRMARFKRGSVMSLALVLVFLMEAAFSPFTGFAFMAVGAAAAFGLDAYGIGTVIAFIGLLQVIAALILKPRASR